MSDPIPQDVMAGNSNKTPPKDIGSKVVLITGASFGIGAHIAEHLATVGYKNFALIARKKPRLDAIALNCKAKGAKNVLVIEKDLTEKQQCYEAIDEAIKHFSYLDILISNAGGSVTMGRNVSDVSISDLQVDLALNLIAHIALTRKALKYIRERKGSILFVSSVASSKPVAGMASYCTAKAGLNAFAKVVALEEASNNVRVNVLSPGMIRSGAHVKVHNLTETMDELQEKFRKAQPLGRLGELQEMSNVIEFIISDKNSFMTGAVVECDGGFVLK